jgi:hypothetical protein
VRDLDLLAGLEPLAPNQEGIACRLNQLDSKAAALCATRFDRGGHDPRHHLPGPILCHEGWLERLTPEDAAVAEDVLLQAEALLSDDAPGRVNMQRTDGHAANTAYASWPPHLANRLGNRVVSSVSG